MISRWRGVSSGTTVQPWLAENNSVVLSPWGMERPQAKKKNDNIDKTQLGNYRRPIGGRMSLWFQRVHLLDMSLVSRASGELGLSSAVRKRRHVLQPPCKRTRCQLRGRQSCTRRPNKFFWSGPLCKFCILYRPRLVVVWRT
jgi:hypothetical protein